MQNVAVPAQILDGKLTRDEIFAIAGEVITGAAGVMNAYGSYDRRLVAVETELRGGLPVPRGAPSLRDLVSGVTP